MTDQKKVYFCNTKEGRAQYYAANKAKINKTQQAKEMCPCCSRVVAHSEMTKHQKTAYCKKRHEVTAKDKVITELYADIYDSLLKVKVGTPGAIELMDQVIAKMDVYNTIPK